MIINRRYDYKYELSLNKSRRDDMIIEGNRRKPETPKEWNNRI